MSETSNGWDEYKLLVLDNLKRIETKQDGLAAQVGELKVDFAQLQTEGKIAKWFGGALVPAGVALGVSWVSRRLGL